MPSDSDDFPVYRFPDLDTVTIGYQCRTGTGCGGPHMANFLAWSPVLGALVGGGGWGFSMNSILRYDFPGGQFPPAETAWTPLPQSGPAPDFSVCEICMESLRRMVLRNGEWVYVDPLSHNLYSYDFATGAWKVTVTSKPAKLPVNGVVGYDELRDRLVVWVGTDALYGTGPAARQTWIYSFATNQWTLGPNHANGDANPGIALAILSYMVWDSNLQRLVLITTDGIGTGYTRLWALEWSN